MGVKEAARAWLTIIQHLDEDCGYEGSELEEPEIAETVKRHNDAWDTLDEFFDGVII